MDSQVSIIINNFNYGRFLGAAIGSALEQNYRHVEVIVVDDGSTDESFDIIRSFGAAIKPISKANGGQGSAFNAGFRESRGDIIIFLDADDILLPDATKSVVEAFQPLLSKVHWPLWSIDASGERSGALCPSEQLIAGDFKEIILRDGPDHHVVPPHSPPTSGNAWARFYLEEVLPMPEEVFRTGADNYLLNLCPLFGPIGAIPRPLGCYRAHGSNDTNKPLSIYAQDFVERHEACRTALLCHASRQGLPVDPTLWKRSWLGEVAAAMPEFERIVPEGSTFGLVAEGAWQWGEFAPGRKRIAFVERYGHYVGDPANDDEGIREVARLCELGAEFIVFPWWTHWYGNTYPGLMRYLRTSFPQLAETSAWWIFQLQPLRDISDR